MSKLKIVVVSIVVFCGVYKYFVKDDLFKLKTTYARVAYLNYQDALNEALELQNNVRALINEPTKESFDATKKQWIKARIPYGQTEALRFFGGPIDSVDEKTRKEGPEGRLNSWPVNEAYIDYVKGKPKSGIVNSNIVLTGKNLTTINGEGNEANVAIGYHAIEFLLWGQDFYQDSAGKRSVKDYFNIPTNERRRQYLLKVVELLIEDLQELVVVWNPKSGSFFYNNFMQWDEQKFMSNILSSLATLSGFELASERIATALFSGEQEDEHSCFSDTTYNDFIANQQGVINVYFGKYGDFDGFGLVDYFAQNSLDFNAAMVSQLNDVISQLRALPKRIDNILISPANSEERQQMKKVSDSLIEQANLFIKIGKANNYKVIISAE